MSDTVEKSSEIPAREKAPAAPILPNGIGMTYEAVAQELAAKSKTIVSADDPILMMVPICNAFLTQQHALQERHKAALAQVMAGKTDSFVVSVQETVAALGQTISSSAVQSLRAAFMKQEKSMRYHQLVLQRHKSAMCWLAAITTVSALVNVGVFVGIFLLRG